MSAQMKMVALDKMLKCPGAIEAQKLTYFSHLVYDQ
jgi:hypothetical protein